MHIIVILCLCGIVHAMPCTLAKFKNATFCDPGQPIDLRVQDYLMRIPDGERLAQFSNNAPIIWAVGMPAYQWWNEALHGVAARFGGKFPHATSFPQVCTTGAAFNRTLWKHIGDIVSTEARAFHNYGRAGLTFWAPNINIARDPRWGRNQETPGEDPYLTGEYATNYVRGMQGNDTKYLKVSSCCKHFAGYSLENWSGVDRVHFNAIIDQRDLWDTYFPAFETCVVRGKASGIMCSYNSVNGIPSCAHHDFMTLYAREQWGFDGYITSDCGAVQDVQETHHYTNTTDETCKVTLEAGMDIDCGDYLRKHLRKAVTDGAVDWDTINTRLTNLFRVQFRLGMFDPKSSVPWSGLNWENVNTLEHQQAALDTARESIVLLKNDGTLPFPKNKKMAVVGPCGNATTLMQGNYYGKAPYLISPFAGIQSYTNGSVFSEGCQPRCLNTDGFSSALSAVEASDQVLLCLSLDQNIEKEGLDRYNITLPWNQTILASEVISAAAGKPLTIVLMNGAGVDISAYRDDPRVNGILWAGYPGQSGGQAIAEIIFGDVNPSGRLPHTIYPANYVEEVSLFDMNMRPNETSGYPGRTYRFYTGDPVYPFGFGLSYSKFVVTWDSPESSLVMESLAADIKQRQRASARTAVVRNATVTNVGSLAGAFTVLLFVIPPTPGVNGNPIKSLQGFEKVYLLPGGKQTVTFKLDSFQLSVVNLKGMAEAVPGEWQLVCEDQVHTLHIQ